MDSSPGPQQPWFLQSSYPVLFPAHDALRQSQADFETFIRQDLSRRHDQTATDAPAVGEDKDMTEVDESETFTLVTDSTSAEIRRGLDNMQVDEKQQEAPAEEVTKASESSHPFMDALLNADKKQEEPARNLEGMMRTENGDLAFRYTNDALVDLFTELEEVVSGPRLMELLNAAWGADPLATLKIIFNARSIHLGKSSKRTFYRCAGWLAQNHPLTLVVNLRWLSRPVIEKKKAKKEGEDDIVIVDEKDDSDPTKFDVQYGVAHGYWKDLLNILALAANNKLDVLSNPRDVLNTENPGIIQGKSARRVSSRARGRGGRARGGARGRMVRGRGGGRGGAAHSSSDRSENEEPPKKKTVDPKESRHQTRDQRHEAAVNTFNTNPVYRALHLTIARLFAEQLEVDLRALRGDDAKAKRNISLCGKWAPSHDRFHDKHTFIVSSIAEILYPRDSLDEALSPTDDRETYLRHAREQYRKDTSALRKQLDIVERNLSANTIKNIKYDRVPSIAMSNYSKLFIQKDLDGFEKYIDRVAEGKANISGATLLPSTLLYKAKTQALTIELTEETKATMSPEQLVQAKVNAIESKVADGQWNTLVQRIKDSGNLENSLAVCDVSGSMGHPVFSDKTCPMDSAIGLSLLIAEVTKPPFGGSFITFSSDPEVVKLDLSKSLVDKYLSMSQAEWGMSTDFVAVFERLILPIAISNSLKQEDMVKRVFVFSDMQFNDAGEDTYNRRSDRTPWATSFERIKKKFEDAGYELPELVFWNLAGGRSDSGGQWGDPVAPKPVTSTEDGTCLVSGYSQGMLKVFLDNGAFEDPEEEEDSEDEIVISKDGDEVTQEKPKKKAKMDPMAIVKKAIGHKAYDMLQVVD